MSSAVSHCLPLACLVKLCSVPDRPLTLENVPAVFHVCLSWFFVLFISLPDCFDPVLAQWFGNPCLIVFDHLCTKPLFVFKRRWHWTTCTSLFFFPDFSKFTQKTLMDTRAQAHEGWKVWLEANKSALATCGRGWTDGSYGRLYTMLLENTTNSFYWMRLKIMFDSRHFARKSPARVLLFYSFFLLCFVYSFVSYLTSDMFVTCCCMSTFPFSNKNKYTRVKLTWLIQRQ